MLIKITVLVALTISANAHPKPICCTCQEDCIPGTMCSIRTACNDNGQLKGTCMSSYGTRLLGAEQTCTVEGAYVSDPNNQCSDAFYRCTNGKLVVGHCPTDLKFNLNTVECAKEEYVAACATVPDTCNPAEDDYMSNPTNPCSGTFYQCSNGKWVPQECPEDLKFNDESNQCDYKDNVPDCAGAPPDTCNQAEDDYLPDPANTCSGTFYECFNGNWMEQQCPMNQKFNAETNKCDSPSNIPACATGVSATSHQKATSEQACTVEGAYVSDPNNQCSDAFYRCTNGKLVVGHCPTDLKFNLNTVECAKEEYVTACATVPDTCNPAEDDYMSNPTNPCSGTFYQCSNGKWVPQECPEDLKFNDETNQCDYKDNVPDCAGAPPDTCNQEEDDYLLDPANSCSGTFYECCNGTWLDQQCPMNQRFNVETNKCDSPSNIPACATATASQIKIGFWTKPAKPTDYEFALFNNVKCEFERELGKSFGRAVPVLYRRQVQTIYYQMLVSLGASSYGMAEVYVPPRTATDPFPSLQSAKILEYPDPLTMFG